MKLATALLATGVERALGSLREKVSAPIAIDLWDGRSFPLGPQPAVRVKIPAASSLKHLIKPTLGSLAEAYVEGDIEVEGSIRDVMRSADVLASSAGAPAWDRVAFIKAKHSKHVDRDAIRRHYDVSNAFYKLWLDDRMVYSCAYFRTGADDINTAQVQKLDHICRKLRLQPGERFLDIGCGWGGLAIHAATHYGVDATGITLSQNQFDLAQERIAAAGLQDRCRVALRDYRDQDGDGAYDKIASVGMFEHVGLRNLPVYFGAAWRLLRDRGLFLNHGITSGDVDSKEIGSDTGRFVDKYIFPHGELPHVSLAMREMSARGFEVTDVESLRPHYAKTLEHWSNRLEAHLDEAGKLVDPKTLRVWRVYLMGSSYGFEQGWMNIYQMLGSKQAGAGLTELPLTREYMYPR